MPARSLGRRGIGLRSGSVCSTSLNLRWAPPGARERRGESKGDIMLRRVVLIGAVLASTLAVAVPAGLAGPSAMTVKIGEQAQLVGTGIVLDVTYSCTQVNAAATGTLNVSVQELVGATSVVG